MIEGQIMEQFPFVFQYLHILIDFYLLVKYLHFLVAFNFVLTCIYICVYIIHHYIVKER